MILNPSFWQIYHFLNSRSILELGSPLQPGSLLPSLSSLLYLPAAYLNLPQLLPWFNALLLFVSAVFISKAILNSKISRLNYFLLLALFFVAPWSLQVITGSPSLPLSLLILSLCFYFTRTLASSARFILLAMATLILVVFANFTPGRPLAQSFGNLSPQTYGYYTDIHRQADLVSGVPFVGKLYYNKYLVIARQILTSAAGLLDWDRFVFISSSGKAPLHSRLYPQFSLFELPFIVLGIFFAFRFFRPLLAIIISAVVSSAIVSLPPEPFAYQSDPGWMVWFLLTTLVIATIPKLIYSSRHLTIILLLILLTRFSLVNISFTDNPNPGKLFQLYSQIAAATKYSVDPVLITDRIGQPHIYLAYFDALPVGQLHAAYRAFQPVDKFNLVQPSPVSNYYFTSFVFDSGSELFNLYPAATWVELSGNFPGVDDNPSVVSSTILQPSFEIPDVDKTRSTNLQIVVTR